MAKITGEEKLLTNKYYTDRDFKELTNAIFEVCAVRIAEHKNITAESLNKAVRFVVLTFEKGWKV